MSQTRFVGPAVPPLGPVRPAVRAAESTTTGRSALTDVADRVMAEYVTGEWEEEAARYDAGRIGSRRLMNREMESAPRGPSTPSMRRRPRSPTTLSFVPFVEERARASSASRSRSSPTASASTSPRRCSTWVSAAIPVSAACTTFADGGASIEYPNGHPACFVCGTCKRNRVLAHRAAGRRVIFIGDGESDRYAAGYADVVFAKRSLVHICVDNGWPFHRWTEFAEIDGWFETTVDAVAC